MMIIFVSLPLVSLTLYLAMASEVFVRDKMAYVYESGADTAQGLANQFKLSMGSFQNVLKGILSTADMAAMRFGPDTAARFQQQKMIEYLDLYVTNQATPQSLDQMVLFPRELTTLDINKKTLDALFKIAKVQGSAVAEYAAKSRFFIYTQRLESTNGRNEGFIVAIFRMNDLYEAFASPTIFSNYVVSRSGMLALAPHYWNNSRKNDRVDDPAVFKRALENPQPQSVFEQNFANGKNMVVSYAETGFGDYITISVMDKGLMMQAFKSLLIRSAAFLIALLAAVVMFGMFTSYNLTRTLLQLVEITTEIAKGNFKFKKTVKSNDEIGILADNVQWMAKEVDRLFLAKDNQARMVAELEMVTTIQENLFPPRHSRIGNFEIGSFFESATEAGGDWFHYSRVGDKLMLWIGDATGHGAPAALITAAAKATSSIIENSFPDLTPGEILKIMNHAIYATSKGSMAMTFFIAAIDIKTGKGRYANASHETPFVVPRKEKLTRKELRFLNDSRGARLGENQEADFAESDFTLSPGDTMVLYTDGLFDLQSPSGESLGERRFLNGLIKSASPAGSVDKIMSDLRAQLTDFRSRTSLVDDVMIIICQFDAA
jgi:sigma-B regulation protein RsbU (phosphoserine phosphatase)